MTIVLETVFWVTLILVVHSYLVYPVSLLFLSLVRKRYTLKSLPSQPKKKISILLSAYNEEATIGKRISELLATKYPFLQIIVGVDGATDQTYQTLRQFEDERLKVVPFELNRGKVWVLNDLYEYAEGDVLMFCDANTRLDGDSFEKLEKHFHDGRVGGVCGRLKLYSNDSVNGSEMESKYWGIESWIKKLEGDQGMTLGANGAIYAIRRELFVPFDTNSRIADDFILPLRIIEKGYYFVYEEQALAFENAGNFKDEFSRKVRIGAAIIATMKASVTLMNPLRGFIAYALWSHKIIRWLVPYFILVMIFSNLILLSHSEAFVFTAIAQGAFYFLAAAGIICLFWSIQVPIISHLGYFAVANVALVVGFVKSLITHPDTKWEVSRN